MAVLGSPIVDPGRPDFQPGFVAPVAVWIAPAFQVRYIIDKFIPAVLAEFVGNPVFALLVTAFTGASVRHGQAAFLARDRTARPAKEVLDRPLFAPLEEGVLRLPGAIASIANGNDVGHGVSGAFNRALKLKKHSTARNALSIGKARLSAAKDAGSALPSLTGHDSLYPF